MKLREVHYHNKTESRECFNENILIEALTHNPNKRTLIPQMPLTEHSPQMPVPFLCFSSLLYPLTIVRAWSFVLNSERNTLT